MLNHCTKKQHDTIFLLFGDFNILTSANFSNVYSYFDDKLVFINLSRLNCIKNNKNTILDYVLTNSTTIDVNVCINPIMPIDVIIVIIISIISVQVITFTL